MLSENSRFTSYAFYFLLFAGIALRFFHFTPEIDDPHFWRQCDTAQYVYSYYDEGIDLLHPKAAWMGSYEELILEFPLPEAIAAVFYKLFGPDLNWARLVFFLFYLGSLLYLFKIIQKLADSRTARIAALLYLFMPLSIYYSRAIHIDFSAVFFSHAMLWYWLQGIDKRRWKLLALGSIAGSFAFMIKAPYAFYLALPLLAYIIHRRRLRYSIQFSPLFLLPILVFLLWQNHVDVVNAAAPDWEFFPNYKKTTTETMWYWYFGVSSQRFDPFNWWILFNRLAFEITGLSSVLILVAGIFWKKKSFADVFFRWWGVGVLVFLFVFINLNEKHNYYQIPLLPVVAWFLARALCRLGDWLALNSFQWLKWGLPLVWVLIFSAENIHYSETHYYQSKPHIYAMGEALESRIPKGEYLVSSYGGFDRRAPHILYHAHRYGWQVPQINLSPALVNRFIEEGAGWLAAFRRSPLEPGFEQELRFSQSESVPIPGTDLTLYLYRLKK